MFAVPSEEFSMRSFLRNGFLAAFGAAIVLSFPSHAYAQG